MCFLCLCVSVVLLLVAFPLFAPEHVLWACNWWCKSFLRCNVLHFPVYIIRKCLRTFFQFCCFANLVLYFANLLISELWSPFLWAVKMTTWTWKCTGTGKEPRQDANPNHAWGAFFSTTPNLALRMTHVMSANKISSLEWFLSFEGFCPFLGRWITKQTVRLLDFCLLEFLQTSVLRG